MRDASVPKVVFLLSDGRTADFPKDLQFSAAMRKAVPNLNIWAYGTGDYVAIEQLVNMTLSYDKIVTNQNLTKLEPMFDGYRGIEICEKAPVCVKGSDKPLDLMLIIDASESVEDLFQEQITFAIERVVQNININPEAVRLALITYSGKSTINFKFNDPRFSNNSAVIRHLNNVKAIKGTTQTPLALNDAVELFMDRDGTSGVRKGVKRVAIVITDGHSARSPRAMASRLQNENVTVFAVSQTPNPTVDESELLVIARDKSRVFTPRNLQSFETEFLQYIGFGCPGLKLGPNSKPSIRGATDVSCTPNSLTVTIRTQKPMNGLIYAQQYSEDSKCVQVASNEKRETTLTLLEGTCGLQKTPSVNGDGYNWNVTVMLQFHPLVITKVDQGLDINCFTPARVSQAEIGRSTIKKPGDTQCSYRIHRYGPEECAALDAQVGDNLFHKWECDNPPNYQFLVHDCEVTSTIKTAPFIDSNGCTIDPFILETPDYSRLVTPRKGDAYVFQEMSAFKFPNQGDIQFRCKISLCDMESGAECTKMIAPKCGDKRPQRSIEPSKAGFAATLNVETKRINVLENERIKPPVPVKYCDIRLRK
uniref:Uncharacterized protein n=1 Tax=Plectus sambesii TaxID=2011161 RepID=A0A914VWI4_9BILA